jgi:1,4-dihydroxy-2-naphthoate octaprenyltransferase
MFDPAAWIQATRPLAQINIALPLLLGQAMAFAALGRFSVGLMYCAGIFGTLVQLVIVFVNDFADRETDAHNTTFSRFSGGSRVLPEGRIAPASLRRAALVVLALLGLFCGGLALAQRPWAPVFALATALLVWAYNHPPLRLAYRGHGELVQGLGIGVVLPLAGYYLQAGTLAGFRVAGSGADAAARLRGEHLDGAARRAVGPRERQAQLSGATRAVGRAAARARAAGDGGGDGQLGGAGAVDVLGTALVAAPTLAMAALAVPLLGSADAENRAECERFVLLAAGAGHLLLFNWGVALVAARAAVSACPSGRRSSRSSCGSRRGSGRWCARPPR